MRYTIFT